MTYTPYIVAIAIGSRTIDTTRYGDVAITTFTATRPKTYIFKKVLYIPDLVANLLSTELLYLKGIYYRTDRQYLFTKYTDNVNMPIADVYTY